MLQYGSEHFRADREIVLAAVASCPFALEHASKEFQADWELVLKAVRYPDGHVAL